MAASKTCMLFGFSLDPQRLGLSPDVVKDGDFLIDEKKLRSAIQFTLGGIIAQGCDRILADSGCYALPYVESELEKLSVQYIQNPITIEKLSLNAGDFIAMFRKADLFLIFDLDVEAESLSDFTSIFARHINKHTLSISPTGLMSNWNY